jgi:hypothetical protein
MIGKLLIILTLVTTSSLAQIKTELFVRIGTAQTVTFCGYQPVTLIFEKRRIFFSCPEIEVDLKVTKRKRYVWYAKQDGVKYEVRSGNIKGEFTVIIVPPTYSGLKAIQISKLDLCK